MLKVANSVISASQIATPITFAGNVTLSTGNLVIGTSGKGIDFSITSHPAGMTSELLSDYEEGTFTASLVSNGGSNPTTPVTTTSYYTKIGRQVCFQINFINVDTTGGVGTVKITGLPFTPAYTVAGVCGPFNFDLNTGTSVFISIESSGIFPLVTKDDAGWVDLLFGAGAGRYLYLSGNYIAS